MDDQRILHQGYKILDKHRRMIFIIHWGNLHMAILSQTKQTLYYGNQTADILEYI